MNPGVSIIMPCYNVAAHLPRSVGSVLSQTFSDWELIAVDDGSGDGTLAWLQSRTDPRLRVHSQPNQGVSAARNTGLKVARGRFIAFLDADDAWVPDFLGKMLAALDANPEAGMAYCGWQNIGLPGPRGQPFVPPDYETPDKTETLLAGCRWPVHAALARRQLVVNAGGFDTRLKNAEDFALWLEVAGDAPIVRVPEVLALYHFHGGVQASNDRARAALDLLAAQSRYLGRHPDFAERIGRTRVREILYGGLLRKGYESYWKRDLAAARVIFRHLMRLGYGNPSDWKYMAPALLPFAIHQRLLRLRDDNNGGSVERESDQT